MMDVSLGEILEKAEVIAVVGCSSDPYRASYHIAEYLQGNGYRIIPVNPKYDEVLGEKCYSGLADIPPDTKIDVVDIFRNSRFTADMVDDVTERAEMTGHKPVIWTQLGVSSLEAKEKAESGGFIYIEDKCMMVEHKGMAG